MYQLGIKSMQLLWFIPTHGDDRYLGTGLGGTRNQFPLPAADRSSC